MRTLPELFTRVTTVCAARTAVVSGARALTFAELRERVLSLAAELRGRGLRAGEHLGILLRNSPEFVVGYWAAISVGAVVVPLNEHYQDTEILDLVDEGELKILLTDGSFRALCARVLHRAKQPCAPLFADTWAGLPPAAPAPAAVDAGAPVMLQFSSGSTGSPKRIGRSHAQILWELDALARTLGFSPGDRFLGVAPFSHVNGLVRTMLASFHAGATVFPVPRFERQRVADLVERERISVFIAVPFMFIALAQSRFARVPDFSSLRLCVSASAPLPARFNREFQERFGIYIRQLYGSTETGTMSVNLSADLESSLDSVGTPLPGVHFAIVDERGQRAETGTVGEVQVESPGTMTGYGRLPGSDAQGFRDGYFCTGDLGALDAEGRLTLHGRLKFVINRGGFKIDPHEVERVLEGHPAVAEVAVVGVATAYGDDRVKAVIVRRAPCTEAELVEFCRGRIADFKVPNVFEFRAELPRDPTGKLRRAGLGA